MSRTRTSLFVCLTCVSALMGLLCLGTIADPQGWWPGEAYHAAAYALWMAVGVSFIDFLYKAMLTRRVGDSLWLIPAIWLSFIATFAVLMAIVIVYLMGSALLLGTISVLAGCSAAYASSVRRRNDSSA